MVNITSKDVTNNGQYRHINKVARESVCVCVCVCVCAQSSPTLCDP